MNNQKLNLLITGWRTAAKKLQKDRSRPELSNSEAWLVSNTLYQCAGDLEVLILIGKMFNKKQKDNYVIKNT